MANGLKKFPCPMLRLTVITASVQWAGQLTPTTTASADSAAVKFGGIYVPANLAVIPICREMMAGCSRMILGSDSHTRYGALGTMGVGEGGPEIVRQLLGDTYDIAAPKTVLVYLEGEPSRGKSPRRCHCPLRCRI